MITPLPLVKHVMTCLAALLLVLVPSVSLAQFNITITGDSNKLPPGEYVCTSGSRTVNMSVVYGSGTIPIPPEPPIPPPSGTPTYRSDYSVLPVPVLPRPGLGSPMIDPTFNTTITRLTDPSMSPSDGANATLGLRHEYSRLPAINSNGTKVVIVVIGGSNRGSYQVRDLATGNLIYQFGAKLGDAEVSWHPTDPDVFLYRTANSIHKYHVDTQVDETVMAFSNYYAITTRQEGRPSDDWRYYTFVGYRDSSYATADLVVADLSLKSIVKTWVNTGVPDWVSMSPSGKYVIVQWTNGSGTRLYNRSDLSLVRTLITNDYPHSDFAIDDAGDEVYVYQASSGAAINELGCPNPPNGTPMASVRLSDGRRKILLGDCYTSDWKQVIAGTAMGWNWFIPHFSGLSSRQKRGWVLVSTYIDPSTAQQPFAREIFWLKLDGSGTVRRITHHHSDQYTDSSGKKDYFAEPHGMTSWDGNTVFFSSTWVSPFKEYDLYKVTGNWWN